MLWRQQPQPITYLFLHKNCSISFVALLHISTSGNPQKQKTAKRTHHENLKFRANKIFYPIKLNSHTLMIFWGGGLKVYCKVPYKRSTYQRY
jgi:hypothetical protein